MLPLWEFISLLPSGVLSLPPPSVVARNIGIASLHLSLERSSEVLNILAEFGSLSNRCPQQHSFSQAGQFLKRCPRAWRVLCCSHHQH